MRLPKCIIPSLSLLLSCNFQFVTSEAVGHANRLGSTGAQSSGLRVIQQDEDENENAQVPVAQDVNANVNDNPQDYPDHQGQETPEEDKKEQENKEEDDDDSSGVPLPILLLGFAFGAYMIRKRLLDNNAYQGRWIVGSHDPDEHDAYNTGTLNHRVNEM